MLDSKALEQFYPSVWMDIALVPRLEPGKPGGLQHAGTGERRSRHPVDAAIEWKPGDPGGDGPGLPIAVHNGNHASTGPSSAGRRSRPI